MTAGDGRNIPEFRHKGEDFEYIARYEPDHEGTETPWVTSIFDDSGRYSPVSGHATDLADAKALAVAYHDNEWQPGSDRDTSNPDNPDYVAESTEGMWGNIKAAVTGNKPKPEYDWDAPTELDRSAKDQQYKDNPDVLSGEHGEAGGKDPLGWQSPKAKAQVRAQNELKGSLDPLAPDDDASRAIKGMRTPTETSKPTWDEQKKK